MSNPTLSVVTIALNEENDLPAFIQNFKHIADEIVIIDDGSTDRTAEIAHGAGEKVRFIVAPRQPEEGFCDQRQKGVDAARGEWLLQVDCDMRLSPELYLEIREAIQNENMAAYRFRLKQYFLNHHVRYGGFQYWNQSWLTRRSITSWNQKIHERIKIRATQSQIGQLNSRMIHLNDIDFMERLRKNHQYSQFVAEQIMSTGKRVSLLSLVIMPLWRGFRSYVLMKGFLDGRVGFLWALYQISGNMTPLYIVWSKQNSGSRVETENQIRASIQKDV